MPLGQPKGLLENLAPFGPTNPAAGPPAADSRRATIVVVTLTVGGVKTPARARTNTLVTPPRQSSGNANGGGFILKGGPAKCALLQECLGVL